VALQWQAYRAPWWLPGGDLQTLWPALAGRRVPVAAGFRRERWQTPDGDFLDLDWQRVSGGPVPGGRPLLVLFHGLEGSSRSHYAQAFARVAADAGIDFVVPHFRGCGGDLNLAPRAYHSGDHVEVGWILERLRRVHGAPLLAAGVSLGGNALLRWAAEAGHSASQAVGAVAAVSAPLDLSAASRAIGRGFNRLAYTGMFLRSMKPKALRKLAQHPGLFNREALLAARDLYAFDDVFTAPLHGFAGVDDYYARASARPHLQRVRVPALVLNAANDPFVPAQSLPAPGPIGPWLTVARPVHGGHVGFPAGGFPGHVHWMPRQVLGWLCEAAGIAGAASPPGGAPTVP
jgi:uncharacterized protein